MTKFQRIYENELCKQIWTYDYSVTRSGPISVETRWKDADAISVKKTMKDFVNKKKTKKPTNNKPLL